MQITSDCLSVDIVSLMLLEGGKNELSILTSHNPCFVSHLVPIQPLMDCQYCCMEIFKKILCTVKCFYEGL